MFENKDIDFLISELNRIKSNINDQKQLKTFVSKYADDIIDLLYELKEKRGVVSTGHASLIKKNIHRTLVEGYSEDNIHEAFSKALGKVSAYFSEEHDVSVTVVGLVDLPKGGHRATLEVQLTPIKLSLTRSAKESDSSLQRRLDDEENSLLKQHESYYLQHLVLEHFVHTSGLSPSIPDHLLIHIHEADILKKMIGKGFFHAAHLPEPSTDLALDSALGNKLKSKVIVKALKYDIDKG
jgi:hypothetical protein